MLSPSTISTKFIVMSDTHNFEFSDCDGTTFSWPLQLPTPKADVLLHCGDLTQVGGLADFKKALKMLGSIDAELKLVIAGNHDLELDQLYWSKLALPKVEPEDEYDVPEDAQDHNLAVDIMTKSELATAAGVTYLTEGTYTLNLSNGATFTIYASPWIPQFGDWAFGYPNHEDRFNTASQVATGITSIATSPILEKTHVVMSHGPPKGILDWCPDGSVGCPNLLTAIRRVKPMLHCFGHILEGFGYKVIDWNEGDALPCRANEAVHKHVDKEPIESPYPQPLAWSKVEGTLALNAAIRTGTGEPANAPWIVNLDLPLATKTGKVADRKDATEKA
ncbi:MAG: hypothetical protein Q9168_001928 [Polycauliona sp. 1 TL-2023]